MIRLNDIFHTVQGEGRHVGRRALFVRLPLCNLACSWCDTKFDTWADWTTEAFLEVCKSEPTRFAVITGGEPTMNKDAPQLIARLKSLGFEIAVETNGHFPIPHGIDWVCCSPKRDRFKDREPFFIHEQVWDKANEFKYVVDDGFEFGALDRHKDNAWNAHLWLSPEHTNWKRNVDRILEYTKANPQWRLNLQTHKLIGVP